MRQSITFRGLTIDTDTFEAMKRTLADVEAAFNAPESYTPKPGDLFRAANPNLPGVYQDFVFLAVTPELYESLNDAEAAGNVPALRVGVATAEVTHIFRPDVFRFEKLDPAKL